MSSGLLGQQRRYLESLIVDGDLSPAEADGLRRMILDRAHAHRWTEAAPFVVDYNAPPERSGWYTTPPVSD